MSRSQGPTAYKDVDRLKIYWFIDFAEIKMLTSDVNANCGQGVQLIYALEAIRPIGTLLGAEHRGPVACMGRWKRTRIPKYVSRYILQYITAINEEYITENNN